jgi:CBS-domain-containing membrane protein
MSAPMTRIEAERDLLKEIVKKLNEDHELSKKALNRLAKVYHRQSYSKELEEQDEWNSMYETIFTS